MRGGRLLAGLVVSLLLGAGTALALALSLETEVAGLRLPPGDRVRAAAEELREDRVHVPDDGRAMLDEAGERRLETIVADSDPAIYVVVWAPARGSGNLSARNAVDQLGAAVDPDGVMVVWEGPGRGDVGVLDGYVWETMAFEGDPEARITELVEQLQGEPIEPLEQETTGNLVGAGIFGALCALGPYGVLMTVVGCVRVAQGRPFVVPGPRKGDL